MSAAYVHRIPHWAGEPDNLREQEDEAWTATVLEWEAERDRRENIRLGFEEAA